MQMFFIQLWGGCEGLRSNEMLDTCGKRASRAGQRLTEFSSASRIASPVIERTTQGSTNGYLDFRKEWLAVVFGRGDEAIEDVNDLPFSNFLDCQQARRKYLISPNRSSCHNGAVCTIIRAHQIGHEIAHGVFLCSHSGPSRVNFHSCVTYWLLHLRSKRGR